LFSYDSHDMGGKQVRREYLKASWVKPGDGLRQLTARIVTDKGACPKSPVYPRSGDPCTEKGFLFYVAGRGDELRVRIPTSSERRMRRFLRDYVRSRGGAPHSVTFWRTPWR